MFWRGDDSKLVSVDLDTYLAFSQKKCRGDNRPFLNNMPLFLLFFCFVFENFRGGKSRSERGAPFYHKASILSSYCYAMWKGSNKLSHFSKDVFDSLLIKSQTCKYSYKQIVASYVFKLYFKNTYFICVRLVSSGDFVILMQRAPKPHFSFTEDI